MYHQFNDRTLCWLYKFWSLETKKHVERAEKLFSEGEIHFSSIADFNDPFDSRPHYELKWSEKDSPLALRGLCQRRAQTLIGDTLEVQIAVDCHVLNLSGAIEKTKPTARADLEQQLESLGIFCFSEDWKSILMWSHYAVNHRGFCVRFKAKSDTPFFGYAQRVSYQTNRPTMNVFQPSSQSDRANLLLAKSECWGYEKEWRIIDTEKGAGPRYFPVNLIDAVILGTRIKPDNETLIRSFVSRLQHKPQIFKATEDQVSYRLLLN